MKRQAIVVALLAIGLMGCDVDSQAPTTETSAPAPATTAPPPSPSAEPQPTLGPDGFGALRLGMTKAQARATGLVTGLAAGDKGECGGPGDGHLSAARPADAEALDGRLFFSTRSNRLVAIYAFPGLTTVEGIALGATADQLKAAYPDVGPIDNRAWVDVAGRPDVHYRVALKDAKVYQLSLDLDAQDCYE